MFGIAFMILSFCLAEMSSALPFSGGSYGYARCTLGIRVGLLIGCFESLEYVLTTVVNCLQCSTLLGMLFNTTDQLASVFDAGLFLAFTLVHCIGGRWMWGIGDVFAVLNVAIYLLYIFGVCQYLPEFVPNASNPDPTVVNIWWFGGATAFMQALPTSVWWFVGVEVKSKRRMRMHASDA
jgi:ethanolamine permease